MDTTKRRKTTSTHTLTVFHYSPSECKFIKKQTERELHSHEVLIRTTHSGLCYTDVHAKESGCGLGHEGVGIIEAVGDEVVDRTVGQRVGWGWLHSSCGKCKVCKEGYRQYCAQASGFAFSDTDQGAFSSARIIDAAFCYPIPEGISSLIATPLMCAGASTYEALCTAGVGSNGKDPDQVGIIGMGGLGHMACLMARWKGAIPNVIFTRAPSLEKLAAARKVVGDHEDGHVWDVTHYPEHAACRGDGVYYPCDLRGRLDVLIVCSNELPDWKMVLPYMKRRATIVLMSIVAGGELKIPYMDFILPGHRIIASTECRKDRFEEMFKFVHAPLQHSGREPMIEEFPMTEKGLEEAFGKLERGEMRFRGVLTVPEGGI
ncbi:hypothetical protein MBLNU457_4163t1 [Dothideomycetes sp. NU457]